MKSELVFYGSSFVATLMTYPLDVIKTRQQLNIAHGMRGLYKGISWQIASMPTFWTVFFISREYLPWKNWTSIYTASIIASTVASPIFVMKTFYQVEKTNIWDSHKKIMKNGPLGYFRGTGSTFLINTKLVPQFVIFDELTKKYNISVAAASITSKVTSATITYPFEVSRTYSRINGLSIRETIPMLYKTNGLYRGFLSYTLLSTLNFTIMMCLQDLLISTK